MKEHILTSNTAVGYHEHLDGRREGREDESHARYDRTGNTDNATPEPIHHGAGERTYNTGTGNTVSTTQELEIQTTVSTTQEPKLRYRKRKYSQQHHM